MSNVPSSDTHGVQASFGQEVYARSPANFWQQG